MNYFTSKQISEVWNISPRRVAQLAELGKLDGAVKKGKKWYIPENAQKPTDNRTKESKVSLQPVRFIDPYIIGTVHSDEQVASFTPDEKKLYELYLLYEGGSLEVCHQMSKELLDTTDNPFIRIGALYLLSLTALYLKNFRAMSFYSGQFNEEISKYKETYRELIYLFFSFNVEVNAVVDNIEGLSSDILLTCQEEQLPSAVFCLTFSEIYRFGLGGPRPNPAPYEILCRLIERDGYWFYALIAHTYLSAMFALHADEERELFHLRRALDIAVAHNTFLSLVSIMLYAPDKIIKLLKDYPSEIGDKVEGLIHIFVQSRSQYAVYKKRQEPLPALSGQDYTFISYCRKDYSIKKIAEAFSLTESGVKKRLSMLYKKCGVKSRAELLTVYDDFIYNMGVKQQQFDD